MIPEVSVIRPLAKLAAALAVAVISLSTHVPIPVLQADSLPQWPEAWTTVDEDPADAPNPSRDVLSARVAWDDAYLYLRLEMVAAPDFLADSRYTWFLGVGGGNAISISSNTVTGATHLLFVEGDAGGDCVVYLLSADGDDTFSAYHAGAYKVSPGPASAETAGCSVSGDCLDLYISLAELGADGRPPVSPLDLQMVWAANQVTGTLTQVVGDSPDDTDIPIALVPSLRVSLVVSPEPVDAGGTLTYTATVVNDGSEALADATGNEFEVAIPEHTAFVPGSLAVDGNPEDAALAYDAESGIITWNGAIEAGGEVALTYQVDVSAPLANGTLIVSQATAWYDGDGDSVNETYVLSGNPESIVPWSSTVSSVVSAPQLVLEAPQRLRGLCVGATRSYSIVFGNWGNGVAEDVRLTLAVDGHLSVIAVEPPAGWDDDTIWSSPLLSPLDGRQSVRVVLRADHPLVGWSAPQCMATITCSNGGSVSITTVVLVSECAGDDDEGGSVDSGGETLPPSPEPVVEPPTAETPAEPASVLSPSHQVASVSLLPTAELSASGVGSLDLRLDTPVPELAAAWLYFELPQGTPLAGFTLVEGNRYWFDGNRVVIEVGRLLTSSTVVASLSLDPFAALPADVDVCSALYLLLEAPPMASPDDSSGLFRLSVHNVGLCRATDVMLDLTLPQDVSVVRVCSEDGGIVSVTEDGVTAAVGTLEAGQMSTLLIDISDRANGGLEKLMSDVGRGLVPDVTVSSL